jgi:LysR family transcriptional regulator, regulator for metE and metH
MNDDNGEMDLEIRHLKLVREVSAAGSLTRAGAALHLTQSALSHQLRDIESRLGTPLFLRVGKRMMLTPAGERLLRSADEVLAAIERTEDAIRQLGGAKRGVLRMTTECYTCYHWLPPLLKRYRRAHPLVDVRIDAAATLDPLPPLLEGRLDLAIVSDPNRDRRIVLTPLFDDEMVVIVDPQHRLASRAYVRPEDLASETLLIYPPKEESTAYNLVLDAAGVAPAVLEMQLTEASIELVKAGLGVALLARWAVDPHVKAGTLRALPLTRTGFKRTWSAATLKDMARVPYVKAFIDLVAAHPPFTARARGVATGGEPQAIRRAKKTA